MSFHSKLKERLKNKLPKSLLKDLPHSYFLVGDVLTIKLTKSLYKYRRKIGSAILDIIPYARSVLLIKSINEAQRTPKTEVIAGSKKTETIHKEHGCLFALDPAKIMWSKGNKAERARMARLAHQKEKVIDMFAGVGYWTIPIAKHAKVKSIVAVDINPVAVRYLKKNISLNKLENVKVLKADCSKLGEKLENSADRIIMGYLENTERFLPAALKMAKPKAVIHFHDICKEEHIPARLDKLKDIAAKNGHFLDVLDIQQIKGYAPKIYHFVYDLQKV